MTETKLWCPFCGERAEYMTESDDGMIKDMLGYCKKCELHFGTRSGPEVEEWGKEERQAND